MSIVNNINNDYDVSAFIFIYFLIYLDLKKKMLNCLSQNKM